MLKLKIACAVLALLIALCSATLFVVVKINVAAAVICIAAMVALIVELMRGDNQTKDDNQRAQGPAMQ